ncbi:1-acylglycerol-3-phosphate O-acyltransferase [Thalassotalea sp. HSM 43]|uniref:1-acylglycerol-3-phosphate O-acyltransferase n=1 Tax=Thalassotalea sp. HSM 43 TaxID=2552945 RepID=UPI001080D061|nr:1-acylglycerol-3-phosphate O-acyltransferase [Thalassotalea sp. HSM 43]QBY04999.1 1-acylglycerol-3-phosphate O-acyltransferase [Thalassotalea sp. HSM 43]
MLAVLRVIFICIALVVIFLTSMVLCVVRPFHRNNVHDTASFIGKIAIILGIKVEIRRPKSLDKIGPVVYVANHQNSYDVFTVSASLPKGTVSIGKKSLKWIPLFGQMYWFTGNILIDRGNRSKAHGTIASSAEKIKERNISVWLFPEGTRSYGRGLLPFKAGAFHTAALANVPVVPVCVSNTHDMVKLNRWNNGKMIIEFQEPINVEGSQREYIRHFANDTRVLMMERIKELSVEAGNPFENLPVVEKKAG